MLFRSPDVAIFLDLPLEKAMMRVRKGNVDRIEREDVSFHKKVYDSYIELCNEEKFNLKRVDADRDIEEIFEDVKSIVEESLKRVMKC